MSCETFTTLRLGRLASPLRKRTLPGASAHLSCDVRGQSEKQFGLMSEIYVEHIARLRGEIEEYVAARARPAEGAHAGAKGGRRERPAVRRPA